MITAAEDRGKIQQLRTLGDQISSELRRKDDLEDFSEYFIHPLQSLDEYGNIIWCNAAWRKAFGYDKEEAIGLPSAAIVSPEDRDRKEQLFERLKNGGRVDAAILHFIHKGGEKVPYLVSSNARFVDGKLHSTRCLLIDKRVLNGCLRSGGGEDG